MPDILIGTTFTRATGKNNRVETVIDIYRTYNANSELVKTRYVTEQRFADQPVIDYDVPAATIMRALTVAI